jgi:hypothetical protein
VARVVDACRSREVIEASQADDALLKLCWHNRRPYIIRDVEVEPVRVPAHLTALALQAVAAFRPCQHVTDPPDGFRKGVTFLMAALPS